MSGAETGETEKRVFESGQAAFDHACQEHGNEIVPETPLLAIVLDSKVEFGADDSIHTEDDSNLRLTLKVASADGGFIALSRTAKPPKQAVEVGDLVCWVPLQHDKALAAEANDERFGWVGLVFATLEPVWEDEEWALREFYD